MPQARISSHVQVPIQSLWRPLAGVTYMQVCPPGTLSAECLHRTLGRVAEGLFQGGGSGHYAGMCVYAMLLVPPPSPPIPVKHACGRSDTFVDWQSVDCRSVSAPPRVRAGKQVCHRDRLHVVCIWVSAHLCRGCAGLVQVSPEKAGAARKRTGPGDVGGPACKCRGRVNSLA